MTVSCVGAFSASLRLDAARSAAAAAARPAIGASDTLANTGRDLHKRRASFWFLVFGHFVSEPMLRGAHITFMKLCRMLLPLVHVSPAAYHCRETRGTVIDPDAQRLFTRCTAPNAYALQPSWHTYLRGTAMRRICQIRRFVFAHKEHLFQMFSFALLATL
jgi:hypothetical protein